MRIDQHTVFKPGTDQGPPVVDHLESTEKNLEAVGHHLLRAIDPTTYLRDPNFGRIDTLGGFGPSASLTPLGRAVLGVPAWLVCAPFHLCGAVKDLGDAAVHGCLYAVWGR